MRAVHAVAVAVTVGWLSAGTAQAQDGDRTVSVIRDARIPESSALAVSTRRPGLLYTVNDSGSDPVVYVVAQASGQVVGTATLSGVELVDPEALAIGADRRLYVADIGDNDRVRDTVALHALAQPGLGDVTVTPRTFRVRYADGPHDAEALVSDPVAGRLVILSKEVLFGAAYRLPRVLDHAGVTTARRVAGLQLPRLVTDAAALPDRGVVVRTYTTALVYRLPGWRGAATIPLPAQRQGESLAVTRDGRRILIGTEGLPSPLVAVPLQATQPPRRHQQSASRAAGDQGWPGWATGAVGVATVLLGGSWLAVRRSQARRSTT